MHIVFHFTTHFFSLHTSILFFRVLYSHEQTISPSRVPMPSSHFFFLVLYCSALYEPYLQTSTSQGLSANFFSCLYLNNIFWDSNHTSTYIRQSRSSLLLHLHSRYFSGASWNFFKLIFRHVIELRHSQHFFPTFLYLFPTYLILHFYASLFSSRFLFYSFYSSFLTLQGFYLPTFHWSPLKWFEVWTFPAYYSLYF